MVHFDCDYMCGAHPRVLEALTKTNFEQTSGYGADPHCERARRLILKDCGLSESEAGVWFLVGGTQTNATVIDAMLHPYQGVIAVTIGHINVHEAGAIEAAGHKVLTLPEHDGKMSAADLKEYLDNFYGDDTWQHMVVPGMVYLTFPTEYGTIYTKAELEAIAAVCHEYRLPLYLDGARLGYGLAAFGCDLTIKDIARICDAFYIGGTKQGLLFGEAVVAKKGLIDNFFTVIKQHGAVLAKGRLLGVQFETMFEDGLYYEISRQAVALAVSLRDGFTAKGYAPLIQSPTNQQFFVLPNEMIDRIAEVASFEYWGPRGESESTIRFVTSWETTEDDIDALLEVL